MRPQRRVHMPALGDEFRSAREARGLTLSDVAEQIHIRSVYLHAIENEEWGSIGAPVYVRGFIRTYARFLGLDAEGAVSRFNQAVPPEKPPYAVAPVSIEDRERSGPSVWAIGGVLVALVLVGFVAYGWWSYAQGTARRPLASVTTSAGGVQPGAPGRGSQSRVPVPAAPIAAPSPAPHHQLAIRLTQRSWLRIVVDGKNQIEGIFPAGTTRTFTGTVADVRVGNAGGVTVSVNGSPAVTLGKAGDVVEEHYTL